jgi:hypothetical protein
VHVPLPWERLLWSHRSWRPSGARYTLTDFRVVCQHGGRVQEMAVDDIADVELGRTLFDRLSGASTVIVLSRHPHLPPLTLRGIRRGAQLAALLELLAGDPSAASDATAVQAILTWTPRGRPSRTPELVAGLIVVFVAVSSVVIALHGEAPAIAYPPDDAIYPSGEKRDHEAIVDFMETTVLPWAQEALGPLKGGAHRVSCETCHGQDAEARMFRMPAVAALPDPDVELFGSDAPVDAQMRNAMYGYLAEADNQAKAAYMRTVVVPGMARILGRPAYDFTRSYEYNRTRFAIGCYHCHKGE